MSIKKPALGRGLSALLNDSPSKEMDLRTPVAEGKSRGSVALVDIDLIERNPNQPRKNFDKQALAELVNSIRTHGVIQPITVRQIAGNKFQIISGERRFRASQLAGLNEVPVYIRTADDTQMLEMAIVENIQRDDLNAIEIGLGFKQLIEECNLTQEALSEKVGKDRTTVTNYLRLLNLPDTAQVAIRDKQISMGHARALLSFDSEEAQLVALEQILKQGLSVRKVEELAKQSKNDVVSKPKKALKLSLNEKKIQDELSFHFNTKISISKSSNGKSGAITIKFKDDNDLQRIISLLDK
jgi:ParB family transcriptional regulator, chromosome partitioning protein